MVLTFNAFIFFLTEFCLLLHPNRQGKGGDVVLKILVGVGLGFLLFTNPEARQITADLLRSTANAIAPEQDGKTFQDRVKDAVVEKVMEGD